MAQARCEKCGCVHGQWPLRALEPGEECLFDPSAPCTVCGEPVRTLSMGGPRVCPACDCGVHRDTGQQWTWQESFLIARDRIKPAEARTRTAPIQGVQP